MWVGMWATSLLRFFSCFFFFTMVSNGVDTMRFPCSALNVKVVRNSKQARTSGRRNNDPHCGGHVCSECQSGSKQVRVNGKSNHDNVISAAILTCKSFVTLHSVCFPQVKRMIEGIGNMLFSIFFETEKCVRSSAWSVVLVEVVAECLSWCCGGVVCPFKIPVCPSKTSPCVRSKRPRVYQHHAHMLKSICAWFRHTRGHFECTHSDVLDRHTGFFSVSHHTAHTQHKTQHTETERETEKEDARLQVVV